MWINAGIGIKAGEEAAIQPPANENAAHCPKNINFIIYNTRDTVRYLHQSNYEG